MVERTKKTYCIPIHMRDPLLKATMYFSSLFLSAGSVQRSGLKRYESGKMDSSWCIRRQLMLMGV
jgi:hypothetical protein